LSQSQGFQSLKNEPKVASLDFYRVVAAAVVVVAAVGDDEGGCEIWTRKRS